MARTSWRRWARRPWSGPKNDLERVSLARRQTRFYERASAGGPDIRGQHGIRGSVAGTDVRWPIPTQAGWHEYQQRLHRRLRGEAAAAGASRSRSRGSTGPARARQVSALVASTLRVAPSGTDGSAVGRSACGHTDQGRASDHYLVRPRACCFLGSRRRGHVLDVRGQPRQRHSRS